MKPTENYRGYLVYEDLTSIILWDKYNSIDEDEDTTFFYMIGVDYCRDNGKAFSAIYVENEDKGMSIIIKI